MESPKLRLSTLYRPSRSATVSRESRMIAKSIKYISEHRTAVLSEIPYEFIKFWSVWPPDKYRLLQHLSGIDVFCEMNDRRFVNSFLVFTAIYGMYCTCEDKADMNRLFDFFRQFQKALYVARKVHRKGIADRLPKVSPFDLRNYDIKLIPELESFLDDYFSDLN